MNTRDASAPQPSKGLRARAIPRSASRQGWPRACPIARASASARTARPAMQYRYFEAAVIPSAAAERPNHSPRRFPPRVQARYASTHNTLVSEGNDSSITWLVYLT